MFTVTFNNYFNIDNKVKGSTNFNKESKELKDEILKSVKKIIEEGKNKGKSNK